MAAALADNDVLPHRLRPLLFSREQHRHDRDDLRRSAYVSAIGLLLHSDRNVDCQMAPAGPDHSDDARPVARIDSHSYLRLPMERSPPAVRVRACPATQGGDDLSPPG